METLLAAAAAARSTRAFASDRQMKYTSLVLLLFCSCCTGFADQGAQPSPLVFVGGRFIFSMVPSKCDANGNETAPAYGIVYQQLDDGTLTKFYQTSGWFSDEVFVSSDGRYLIQMGPWNGGTRPRKEDLAFAIYREGQIVRRYSTAELVLDHDQVSTSVSHYEWLSRETKPRFSGEYQFTLCTIDGWTYEFDLPTGKVLSQKQEQKRIANMELLSCAKME